MTAEKLAAIWFIVGIAYVLVNGLIRKIDTDGDWLLPIGWFALWPIMIPSVIIAGIYDKLFNKESK